MTVSPTSRPRRCPLCGHPAAAGHGCPHPLARYLGKRLDERHTLDRVLGKGGMGVVFGGLRADGQRVAVKMLLPALASRPELFERFRREAQLASRLRHPNVVAVYDVGQTPDGGAYYVMEEVPGESLRALVRREGALPLSRAVRIVEQIAAGLGAARAAGIVHRDLKPHNVMVDAAKGDATKVLDFGLVKAVETSLVEGEELTGAGQVLGTPSYMAPEQASGSAVDHRADLFSLGATLYFCLTGVPPCKTNVAQVALAAIQKGEIPPVSSRRVGAPVPDALERFLLRALAYSPEARPQTAEQFVAELRESLEGAGPAVLDAQPETHLDPFDSSPSHPASAFELASWRTASGVSLPAARSRGLSERKRLALYVLVGVLAGGAIAWGAQRLLAGAETPAAASQE